MAKHNNHSCCGSAWIPLTLMFVITVGIFFALDVIMKISDQPRSECAEPWRRWDYIWPSKGLACWLADVPKKKSCPLTEKRSCENE